MEVKIEFEKVSREIADRFGANKLIVYGDGKVYIKGLFNLADLEKIYMELMDKCTKPK